MVDLSKFSADVRNRIENIMATKVEDGGGKNANEIDSQKEYNELSKLLSGDGKVTGKQKEIVEGMLTDYEDKYMVRDEVKQRVADIVKNGDERTADDNAEIKELKNYKKTKGLSKEEKAFIQRVIDGKEIDVPKNDKEIGASKQDNTPADPLEKKTPAQKSEKKLPPEASETKPCPGKDTDNLPKKDPAPAEIMPVPVPVPVTSEGPHHNNNNNNSARQGGQDNINVIGNTVVINGESKTDKAGQTPETPKPNEPKETPSATKPKKPTRQELETLANQIFDAVDGIGTKDAQLKNALKQISKDNIIELLETYNAKHPDMFEAILDDLSGNDYTMAVNIIKDALLARGNNDQYLMRIAGNIDNELDSSWRSDDTILRNLHDMVNHIKAKEREA